MVKNSFIEMRQFIEAIPMCTYTYVTENKEENYLEIYIFQVSCPLSFLFKTYQIANQY